MARQRTFRKVPKGRPKPLYPNGWPSNMQATLYFNNERRDKFLPAIEQGQEWIKGIWYQVGDTVVYSTVEYRCVTTHESRTGREPDTATNFWAEVV